MTDNEVVFAKHYRHFVIFLCGNSLTYLDFQKVTKSEREAAQNLFSTEAGWATAEQIRKAEALLAEVAPVRVGRNLKKMMEGEDAEMADEEAKANAQSNKLSVQLSARDRALYAHAIGEAEEPEEIERYQRLLDDASKPPADLEEAFGAIVDAKKLG